MMEPFEICSGCELSEYDIIENFHKKNSSAIKFLENHGVLPKEVWCPTCKTKCDFREEKNIFVCRNIIRGKKGKKKCSYSISKFTGTFMERSKLPAYKIVLFVNIFVRKHFSHDIVIENLQINKSTSVDWRSFCSEVCENWLHHQEPIGGENVVVEIDETLMVKRKYNCGRELSQVWLFGGIERVSKKIFIIPLVDQKRDAATLIPLIHKYIKAKSIIISDAWKAYAKLSEYDYTHQVINHSENFVNPLNKNIHTQNIERL